jgi:hypothetical protein
MASHTSVYNFALMPDRGPKDGVFLDSIDVMALVVSYLSASSLPQLTWDWSIDLIISSSRVLTEVSLHVPGCCILQTLLNPIISMVNLDTYV